MELKKLSNNYNDWPVTLTAQQVSKILGINKVKVYEMAKKGTIHAIRVGNRVLIPRDPLIAWLNCDNESKGGAQNELD